MVLERQKAVSLPVLFFLCSAVHVCTSYGKKQRAVHGALFVFIKLNFPMRPGPG
jgi:hypothetical protein